MNPLAAIRDLLDQQGVAYELIKHEPVYTSEEAARVRGVRAAEGAKSLLLKSSKGFVLFVLPGDRRLDLKKAKALLGVDRIRFATPEEVREVMGCEVGACYPFGSVAGVVTYVDPSLSENEAISFNPGVHDRTIRLSWGDFERVTDSRLVQIAAD